MPEISILKISFYFEHSRTFSVKFWYLEKQLFIKIDTPFRQDKTYRRILQIAYRYYPRIHFFTPQELRRQERKVLQYFSSDHYGKNVGGVHRHLYLLYSRLVSTTFSAAHYLFRNHTTYQKDSFIPSKIFFDMVEIAIWSDLPDQL